MAAGTRVNYRIRRYNTGRVTVTASTKLRGKTQKSSATRARKLRTDMRAETPVITGFLKKGWTTSTPTGTTYRATNPRRYAAAVDVNGKSAGYVRRGVLRWQRRLQAGR